MPADVDEPALELGDTTVCEPAVGLELGLSGASRADAAAHACGAAAAGLSLEVLPHAPHAREVVLELRELDLELSLRRDGMLREDVEDQLRAVDHPGRERVLERALLGRLQLVVDEQHLGVRVAVGRLQLLELAFADVAPGIRLRTMLDDLRDRGDAGGARELAQLGELLGAVGALRQHGEKKPALGLRLGPSLRAPTCHQREVCPSGGR